MRIRNFTLLLAAAAVVLSACSGAARWRQRTMRVSQPTRPSAATSHIRVSTSWRTWALAGSPSSFAEMNLRLTLIALCLPAILLAQPTPSSGIDRTIRRLEDRWRAAQQANDTAVFHELLAPDVTFIGTSGTLRSRADYIASRSGSWIPRSSSFTVDELRLRFYGPVVIVTGRETSTGAGTNATGRFTHVWARRDGTWTLVALQRTEIAR